jgi:NADH-quinone oxidoreductase subunit N
MLQSMRYAMPEIALAIGALVVITWNAFVRGRARFAGVISGALLALIFSAIASAQGLRAVPRWPLPALLFDGQRSCDAYACGFRLLFAVVTAIVLLATVPTGSAQVSGARGHDVRGEMVALILVACLGMNLMAMAHTLLLVYLAIETVSVSSFVLSALHSSDVARSQTAALKYVVYGGTASGVMLFGMSWLYGLSHSIALPEIAERSLVMTRELGHVPNAVGIAAACVLVGLAYKVAAVPFHMWAPDVYEAAPGLVAGFLAVGPPAAGLALLVRVAREGFSVQSLAAEPLAVWSILAGSLAVMTMTVANLAALAQTEMKRLLSYATIAQAGMMLLAVSVFDAEGISALAFYLVAYCCMTLGAFVVAFVVSQASGGDGSIAALRGLGSRAPALAAALTVFLVSLVGLPPCAGFTAKVYVIASLLRAPGEYHAWYWLLACAGIGNMAVAMRYTMRVLRTMYLQPPAETSSERVFVHKVHGLITLALAIPTLLLGVFWGPLYDFISERVSTLP